MMKNYFFFLFIFSALSLSAQEVLTFSGYDGSPATLIATSTVNDEITIVIEDIDIVNNFYTENQTEIYMYGGLDTPAGGFQGTPPFGDLGQQPQLTLFNDSDASTGPNTYSITINLASHYSSVTDGTMVFGFNLLFQNQFSGGGNNQTADLYIDLTDAMKDSTLSNDSFELQPETKATVNNKVLSILNTERAETISIYNILGQNIFTQNYKNQDNVSINLTEESSGLYIVRIQSGSNIQTVKILLD